MKKLEKGIFYGLFMYNMCLFVFAQVWLYESFCQKYSLLYLYPLYILPIL